MLLFGKHTDAQSGEFVEVDQFVFDVPDATYGTEMSLVSTVTAAVSEPGRARVVVLHEPDGAAIAGENLLSHSAAFDDAAWTLTGTTVTVDAAADPNSGTSADTLVEDTANTTHAVSRLPTIEAGALHTLSVHAKAAGRTELRLTWGDSGSVNFGYATFDLAAGTFGATSLGGAASDYSAAIEDLGSGWYRCLLTGMIDSSTTQGRASFNLSSGGSISYLGDGASGVHLWGAQLEKSPAIGPYTATGAAATGSGFVPKRDIAISASRDSGTTWSAGPAEDQGTHDGGVAVLSASMDLSGQPSGTAMRWKVETPSKAKQKIHGVSLQWS